MIHLFSYKHTCRLRPLSPALCVSVSVISWLVIMVLDSHEQTSVVSVFCLSPFSDCHQVLRRLGAKVVTTFSMVWLPGLVSSSYISLELHIKHLVSWKIGNSEGLVCYKVRLTLFLILERVEKLPTNTTKTRIYISCENVMWILIVERFNC